jgi:hypothetical protein
MRPIQHAGMTRSIVCALCALLLVAPGFAAQAPENYRLTASMMQKLRAVDEEAKRLGLGDRAEAGDDEDDDDDEAGDADIDDVVRRMEADPAYRSLLARHGLPAREVALAAQALLHAGMYLAAEGGLGKDAARRLYDGYTSEQRANIELLRKK